MGYHAAMSTTTRDIDATPEQVFAVLCDGWTYASWVVGASRIREVDADWPAVGSQLHHSVGVWPVLIHDSTEVEDVSRPRMLQLQARAWPSGVGRIRLDIEPYGDGCRVVMSENIVAGPARFLPAPVENAWLNWRNTECLRRLSYLAERRDRQ